MRVKCEIQSSNHNIYKVNVMSKNIFLIESTYVSLTHVHWGRDKIDTKRQFSNAFPNALISLKISLQFVPKDRLKNIPALVQIMAWCRPGDKPLSEPMLGRSLTHTCVTGRQWVKEYPGLDISQNFPLPDFQNFALFSIQIIHDL